ncbi:acetyltransferase [Pullulanibacillus camelliae]|uniref:Acetyltransferase n=1 Tax=Pullulanibacillus camelliae TaxID=1707096 RepID=A0A8J2VN32_9BACL|nr:GNAT family N-acetyltransferase [Pullulanibacillus camelliae]GGE32904.1 acetyltransferase [Pullulanibacillus camelliae]
MVDVIIKKTADLTPTELVMIFQHRVSVFVVEQHCPYQEVDQDDFQAIHVFLLNNNKELNGYTRIIERKEQIEFGRVLVPKSFRKENFGKLIVQETIAEIKRRFPKKPIKISAQAYLIRFYSAFGFKKISEVYLEDGIPHIDMILSGATQDSKEESL